MGTIATLAEQSRARLFLQLIGAQATNLMILAIVAWMRVAGRAWDTQLYANRLRTGAIYTPVPPGPYPGYEEYNQMLRKQAELYQAILAAARHGLASEFLVGLVQSTFSPTHYGGLSAKNPIFTTFQKFTGLAVAPPKPVKQPPPATLPKYPASLRAPGWAQRMLDRQGREAYATERFYRERHPKPVTDSW